MQTLIVTCAYGQFVPEQVLTHPRFGAINLHASLYRNCGAGAPVHKAIINGDAETGMSMMRMVRRMDSGAVMAQCRVPISETDTAGTLFDKLAVAGGDLLIEQQPSLFDGSAVFVEQDESQATFAYTITPQEERIDLSRAAVSGLRSGPRPDPVSDRACAARREEGQAASGTQKGSGS